MTLVDLKKAIIDRWKNEKKKSCILVGKVKVQRLKTLTSLNAMSLGVIKTNKPKPVSLSFLNQRYFPPFTSGPEISAYYVI